MQTQSNNNRNITSLFTVRWQLVFLLACTVAVPAGIADERNQSVAEYKMFQQAVEKGQDAEADALGKTIFDRLCQQYNNDKGFKALQSKLSAAEFLANQMTSQLVKATSEAISVIGSDMFGNMDTPNEDSSAKSVIVAPAKEFYESSVRIFSMPIRIASLPEFEKQFLGRYYNLKLASITHRIAQAGQALAIAQPTFTNVHDYVLVLPLLHATDTDGVNITILPKWLRDPEQLEILSDSCLLHFGLPFCAMTVARQAAQMKENAFSEAQFYELAAGKCGTDHANTAVDCLNRAIGATPAENLDLVVPLQFRIFQIWSDSRNHVLAAAQAKKIFTDYPQRKEYGKAVYLYYLSLVRTSNANVILADIDTAIDDKRCKQQKAQIMFIKWWALRRNRDQEAQLALLEDKLLEQYGNDPLVAPIMFAQAMDCMAGQDYRTGRAILTDLTEKFPSSRSAVEAKKTLAKWKIPSN